MSAKIQRMTAFTFYLGTHQPAWMLDSRVPLFISASRLATYSSGSERAPTSRTSWAVDSGGFTEVSKHGGWRTCPDEYGSMITRFWLDFGAPPDFVAPQDWMCEPDVLQMTGLTVRDHQDLTVDNYLYLSREFYFLPWLPVLQGWTLADYLRCADMYEDAGVDLAAAPRVGVGSVCRRQSTSEIGDIFAALQGRGYRLHGFGVKSQGLAKYGRYLASADSLAWSARGRRVPGCAPGHKSEANCRTFAQTWRDKVVASIV